MTTRIGFIKGVLGLAFTASVAIRGAAQETTPTVPEPTPTVPGPGPDEWSVSGAASAILSSGAVPLYLEYRSSTGGCGECASREDAEAFLKWLEDNREKIRTVVL